MISMPLNLSERAATCLFHPTGHSDILLCIIGQENTREKWQDIHIAYIKLDLMQLKVAFLKGALHSSMIPRSI